jgi:hypothetical protein
MMPLIKLDLKGRIIVKLIKKVKTQKNCMSHLKCQEIVKDKVIIVKK